MSRAGGAPGTRVRKSILVIDDEKLIRWSIRESIRGEYQVHLAESAEQAFEMLERLKRIDAVIVDVRLPGMDGLEFVKRARESCPDLKVFVMTAYNKEKAPKDAFQVRADGYLSKPFQMETLKDMLASHLSGVHP